MPIRRNISLLIAGNGLSLLGDGMFVIAIGFAVLHLGGGAGALGMVLLAGVGTIFLCILPAGVLVDRMDRRRVVAAADLTRGILQLASAAIVAMPGAHWAWLLPTSIIFGLATAMYTPAAMALPAEVVPRDHLEKVNGGVQALRGVGLVVGSALAGIIVAHHGPVPVMIVDAVTFFACGACIWAIRIPARQRQEQGMDGDEQGVAEAAPATTLADIRAGIATVREHRWLVHGLLVIAGFVVVSYAPIQVIGPSAAANAADAAGVSAAVLWSWMSAATAVGMIIGGVTAIVRPPGAIMTIVRALLVVGALGPIGLALDVDPMLTLPGFAALGGGMGLFAAGWESAKQARVDSDVLSRVASLDMFAQLVGMVTGVVLAAAFATFVSVDAVLIGIGAGCLLLAAASRMSRSLTGIFHLRAAELGNRAVGDHGADVNSPHPSVAN